MSICSRRISFFIFPIYLILSLQLSFGHDQRQSKDMHPENNGPTGQFRRLLSTTASQNNMFFESISLENRMVNITNLRSFSTRFGTIPAGMELV